MENKDKVNMANLGALMAHIGLSAGGGLEYDKIVACLYYVDHKDMEDCYNIFNTYTRLDYVVTDTTIECPGLHEDILPNLYGYFETAPNCYTIIMPDSKAIDMSCYPERFNKYLADLEALGLQEISSENLVKWVLDHTIKDMFAKRCEEGHERHKDYLGGIKNQYLLVAISGLWQEKHFTEDDDAPPQSEWLKMLRDFNKAYCPDKLLFDLDTEITSKGEALTDKEYGDFCGAMREISIEPHYVAVSIGTEWVQKIMDDHRHLLKYIP